MGPFSFLLSLLLVDLELFLCLLILPPIVRVLVFLSHHSLQRSLLTDTRHALQIRAAKQCRVNHVRHCGSDPTRIGGSGHEPEYSQLRVQVAFEKLRAWRAVELYRLAEMLARVQGCCECHTLTFYLEATTPGI